MPFPRFYDLNYIPASKVLATDKLLKALFLWMIPVWITPNHITLLRFFLTPFVIVLLFLKLYSIGVPLFLFAALTDALDGALARTRNQITPWGMLFDPFADKLLIVPVLFLFLFSFLPFIIIGGVIILELSIIILALWWRKKGLLVQANVWGKIKMLFQVGALTLLLLAAWFSLPLAFAAAVLLCVSIICGVMSLLHYGI